MFRELLESTFGVGQLDADHEFVDKERLEAQLTRVKDDLAEKKAEADRFEIRYYTLLEEFCNLEVNHDILENRCARLERENDLLSETVRKEKDNATTHTPKETADKEQ